VCHPVVVVRGNGDHGGRQLRRRIHHQGPRRIPQIRGSAQRESSAEPGLPSQPGHGVGSVINLMAEWLEVPTGAERATATLVDNVVALGCVVAGREEGDPTGAAVGV
jgi:hypothetical protein